MSEGYIDSLATTTKQSQHTGLDGLLSILNNNNGDDGVTLNNDERQALVQYITQQPSLYFDPLASSVILLSKTPTNQYQNPTLYNKKPTNLDNDPDNWLNSLSGIDCFYPLFQPRFNVRPLIIPPHWHVFIEKEVIGERAPVVVTSGTKDVGKSTFNRTLVNRLLSRYGHVLYVELDVGQCEFAPCGLITLNLLDTPLLGPPFTHQHTPIRSYFFGETSPKNNPEYYVRLAKEVLDHAMVLHQEFNIPVVTNTLGWIKGLGLLIQEEIVKHLRPSHVVYLYHAKPPQIGQPQRPPYCIFNQQGIDEMVNGQGITKLFTIESAVSQGNPLIPLNNTATRDLSMKCYFDIERQPLIKQRPYAIKFNQVKIGIINHQVPYSQSLYALNASIVGICSDHNSKLNDVHYQVNSEYPTFIDHHKDVPVVECLGLGVVRSIDVENRLLFILTPIPHDQLEQCSILLKGSISMSPESSLTVTSKGSILTPYLKLELVNNSGSGTMERGWKTLKRSRPAGSSDNSSSH
ncbi:hypothetical protein SAMD00019534_039200 [Acytostelium subglobosum LB1]|uniref:hypothetical protein n=1 Tax=Acytostelium subglobosum LB1 TaxID=1410327 RepID=UPI000644CB5A|nr:hypothetical protein SAMD00019534_039200 [Acytostelium subglobosum LB1]GAM20745.1 hypothetical protein SAMD00019534_039200 [Acytostelium subglobosum LB1]|eukprot:XP_012755879.1 hypothetical protein SAMD00019534_039200 [Acytostelium subglobosum LB1]